MMGILGQLNTLVFSLGAPFHKLLNNFVKHTLIVDSMVSDRNTPLLMLAVILILYNIHKLFLKNITLLFKYFLTFPRPLIP